MEGILVLPIYLMMLGALFIMGELARTRLQLQSVERTTTWLAADRFAEHDPVGMGKILIEYLNVGKGAIPPGNVFEDVDGDALIGNRWLDGYKGYMVLPVEVPYWYGMANAEHVMDRRGNDPPGDEMPFKKSYLVPPGASGKGDLHARYYVVRRRPDDAGPLYDRGALGTNIAGYVVYNVVQEPWIVGDVKDVANCYHELRPPEVDPEQTPPPLPYMRDNDLMAYGE